MEQTINDDEIDLLSLMGVLLKRRKLIIGITLLSTVVAVGLSILSLILPPEKSFLPNLYQPKALMLINDASSQGGGLSALLNSSGIGGLASLAGVNVAGGSTYSQLAVYLAGTNSFLDAVVDRFDLVARYKIEKNLRADSRMALKKRLSAEFDDKSGVFSISFEDRDPAFAQQVVNFCADYFERRFSEMGLDKNKLQKDNLEVNIANTFNEIRRLEMESQQLERSVSTGRSAASVPSIMLEVSRIKREIDAQGAVYTQLKTQYELVKVAMASETPIFQVLERAEVPDKKSGPSRGLICVVVTFAGFFFSILLVFVMDAVSRIRKDEAALARLRGEA